MLKLFFTPPTKNNIKTTLTIRSGAQTGVDRGTLDAALSLGVPICGWIPKGRLAREPIPESYNAYLKEMTAHDFPLLANTNDEKEIYNFRTEQNAKEGDGTLIIIMNEIEFTHGTAYTKEMAEKHNRPTFILNLSTANEIDSVSNWILENNIKELNVGGPSETKSPGIYKATFDLIARVLQHPKLTPEVLHLYFK